MAPILIVDKGGFWGERIADILKDFSQVVLVSPQENEATVNPLFVKFHENIPQIPSDNYSHVIIFWDGDSVTKLLVEASLEKAKADNARMLVFFTQSTWNSDIAAVVRQHGGVVGVIGDVFGSGSSSLAHVPLDHYIVDAKKKHGVELADMGLVTRMPISYSETVKALLTLIFQEDKPAQIQLLYPAIPTTELGFLNALKKIDPEIGIRFLPKKDLPTTREIPGVYVLNDITDPLKELPDVYAHTEVTKEEIAEFEEQVRQMQPPAIVKHIKKQKPVGKWFVWMVSTTILLSIFAPLLLLLGAGGFFLSAKNAIESGNVKQSIQSLTRGVQLIDGYQVTSSPWLRLATNILPQILPLSDRINGLSVVGNSALTIMSSAEGMTQSGGYASVNLSEVGAVSRLGIQQLLTNQWLAGEKKNFSITDINTTLSALSLLPVMAPQQGTKHYLILFQNNAELRPGGGFIGSYAIADVTNGQLANLDIKDVYDADGQLKGHVEPPFFYRRYLAQPHLYLRDSNYEFDFPTNAQHAESMLHAELGQDVDGVIGVDLFVVQGLLQAVGPVYIPDFQETVTADTFFQQAESHSQDNFFAGSTQKKDYLGSVVRALMPKLSEQGNMLSLSRELLSLVQKKHIQIYSNDQAALDILTASHMSGSVWDGRPKGAGRLNDTLFVNEANVGVNKANQAVTRTLDQTLIASSDGTLSDQVVLQIQNTNQEASAAAGMYTSYVRFLIPDGSTLSTIAIDGGLQHVVLAVTDPKIYEGKTFKVDPMVLEVNQTSEFGKKSIGFLIRVPQNTTQNIQLTYQLPWRLTSAQSLLTYSQQLIKQSGIESIPYTFHTQFNGLFHALTSDAGKPNSDGSLEKAIDLQSDVTFTFPLARN